MHIFLKTVLTFRVKTVIIYSRVFFNPDDLKKRSDKKEFKKMKAKFYDKSWKKSMTVSLDYNNMMTDFVGERNGITDREISSYKATAKKAHEMFTAKRGNGMTGWAELPYNQDETVKDIIATAKEIRKKFDYFVVLGIGGSALGPIAVFQALCHLHYNDLPKSSRKGPKFYVEDNIDPERMTALFDVIDVKRTMFNVITKSGSTSETMSQYLIVYDALKKALGDDAKNHIIATTSETKGNLIKIAKEEGFKTFYIPESVGGRFSELCPVGLLPASVLGINIKEMLEGAKYMDSLCKRPSLDTNPALMQAVLLDISVRKGKNIHVMMPYADSLKYISDWYAQLWAESLGKKVNNDGVAVYAGQTPVKSLGVTDQHSQVQLYTEGPFDKVVTFIGVGKYRKETPIPYGCEDIPDVAFLCGHTMNELISSEMFATEYALTVAQRSNYRITLPEVNAFTIGELLYMFELQTAYAGEMLDVDAYNQPGVEGGKNATYAMLGRKGYEKKAEELANAPKKSDFYKIN